MNTSILLKELLDTDKTEIVRKLIDEFVASNQERISWRAVGDRPNNSGTIQAAGDPMRALIERVTNGIDAVIDRAYKEHGGKPVCTTPKEASQVWFGVPRDGLHKMSDSERRKLAQESVHVTLYPGDGQAKRTVDVSDFGTGLSPDLMPRTILSLNESNKLDKFYLAGAFGQGGSATLASCDYTLIASRSIDSPGTVGYTVVKYEPPRGVKLGSYVYLVYDGQVLVTGDIPTVFGTFATRVRHYGYDLDDYNAKLGPASVYGRSQTILFDPVLPFWFRTELHSFGRTIKGSRAALNGARDSEDDESKLSHSVPLFFSDLGEFGQIGIEYWVLEGQKSAPNRAFVNGTKPIVVSVNGQVHTEWSAKILRKDADLLHIASRMIVHIDCNKLSLDAKNAFFVSNREESRKGLIQNLILNELIGALRSDDQLRVLNDKARSESWKQRDELEEREIRREVAKMLKIFGFSVAEAVGGSGKAEKENTVTTARTGPRAKPDPIPPQDPPTFVSFVAERPTTLYPGQRRFIRIRTDALSTYHSASDSTKSRFSFLVEGEHLRFVGSTELRDGHMRAILTADIDALAGGVGRFTVELRPPASTTLSDKLDIAIVPTPEPKSKPTTMNIPDIDIQPIGDLGGEEWTNWGWPEDASEVGVDYQYQSNDDKLTIRYSSLLPRFKNALDGFTAKDSALATSFRKRYEIWLTTIVLIHWQDSQADPTSLSDADLDDDTKEGYRRDELRRSAKTAVVYAQREAVSLSATPTDTD